MAEACAARALRGLAGLAFGVSMAVLAPPASAEDPQAAATATPAPSAAPPTDGESNPDFAIHGQATVVDQVHPSFRSPFQGPNSLSPDAEGRETVDVTLFAGWRPWSGAEIWINPEIDQGFGLDDTLGVAGFPSAEAYKVGKAIPYLRLQRFFLRQTIDLGGGDQSVDPAANQFGGHQSNNRIVLTIGKFSVPDIFDTNDYAHDSKHDFLNWAVVDAGTFDYAADAWGYTAGGAAEWYQGPWTLRLAVMDLSIVPNSEVLDPHFGQFQMIGEGERRWTIAGKAGALRITGFISRGRMGKFDDAIALGAATGEAPGTALVREYRSRGGFSFDAQQQITGDLGAFARAGVANGDVEPYEFTDIDRTIAVGLSLKGARWGRPDDTAALAGVIDGVSAEHERYLADGGLGILVGDGRLPHPGDERIIETYYDLALRKAVHMSLDYQLVDNPGYDRDRGPVSIFSARVHLQF
jgi:high affinity Mn2+ porin